MATTSQLDWRAQLPAQASVFANHRRCAQRCCQAVVLLSLFCLILLPEYVQGLSDPNTKSILYRATIGPLRLVDVLLLVIIFLHAIAWAGSRRLRIEVPKFLALPALGFLLTIVTAVLYGALHGGSNLFFDWRALALAIGIYTVFSIWLSDPQPADFAIHLFAAFMALRIAWILADFFTGGGDLLVGVRIPVFDGPTLSAVVFTALLSACLADVAPRWPALFWTSLCAAAYLLVLLSFRRTFWAELGLGTLFLLLSQRERRGRKLLLAAASLLAVAALLGPAFYQRVQSMDFTRDETEFSQGNPDHVGEVLDAWEQVQRNPVMGIGLGRSFQTLRIQDWKEESVMVHNAPLHVWLKYGLLGLVCYAWFHFALFRWLWRQRQISRAAPLRPAYQTRAAWLGATLAYLAAQIVVSLGFTPWPYSSLQSTILIAFLLAAAMSGANTWNYQPCPSSLPR
jgi:O-Antigen ligase